MTDDSGMVIVWLVAGILAWPVALFILWLALR